MARDAAAGTGRYLRVLTVLSLLPVALLLLHTGLDLLPPDPLISRFTLARLLLVVGLVAVLAQGARWRDIHTDLDWVIAVLVGVLLVVTWRTGFGAAELRGLLEQVGFFYLVVVVIRRNERSDGLPWLALLAVVAAAGVGVAQFAQDTPTTFYRDGFASVTSVEPRPDLLLRGVGTFANPNLMAAYVLLLAPFAVLAVTRVEEFEHRVVAAVATAVAFLGLVLSFSRAGLVGLALAGAVVGAVTSWTPRRRSTAGRVLVLLAVAGAGLVAVALAGLIARVSNRDEAWRLALDVAADNPLLGVGLGRAGDVMNAVGDPQLPYFHAHNLWLNWLVEAGPLAAVAMAVVVGVSLWVGARRAAAGSGLALAGLAGLVGFVVVSMVDHPANLGRIALAFWFVLAAIHAPRPRPPGGRATRPVSTRRRADVPTRDPRWDDTIVTVREPAAHTRDVRDVEPPVVERRS